MRDCNAMDSEAHLVLVVEDDPDISLSLKEALEGEGYSVIIAPGIREAIFKLKNQPFKCIILDLKLRDENGADLVDLVREKIDLNNLETPILVVSGNLSKEMLLRLGGKIQGALVKPVQLKQLLDQVRSLIV